MSTRRKQPEQTRRAILDAAGHGFGSRGYSGTGLGWIVEQAELTKGALFHHFRDKESLARAWIEGDLAAAVARIWTEPLAGLDSLDGFKFYCRTRCLELQPEDATSTLVAFAAETAVSESGLREALERVFAGWREAVAGWLDAGKEAGWIHRSIQPPVEAAFLVSAIAGLTVAVRMNPDLPTRRAGAGALEGYLETLRAS